MCENDNSSEALNQNEEDQRRLFEYFIVAGLNDHEALVEFPSQHSEGKNRGDQKAPITDICVLFTSAGEAVYLLFILF